jgi:hypothetical protein
VNYFSLLLVRKEGIKASRHRGIESAGSADRLT